MRQYVNTLSNGVSVDEVFLVADKQLRANRQGNLYLHLDLRDKTGTVGARLWNATERIAAGFEPGDYLRVRAKVQVFQGALQMIVSHLEVADSSGLDPDDFTPRSTLNGTKLLARLKEILLKLSNPHLRALVECFLIDDEFVRKFVSAPAGIKNHHAYNGGLLEHVVTLLETARAICEFYPEIDRDLLLTGVFLHDIGKIDELSYDRAFSYTDEGQLIGHLVMGVEMLRDKVERTADLTGDPFPAELLLRVKHMIVSHHGLYEYGSPKLPMTPEAIALHYLDNLDAKIHSFTREIRDDPGRESRWTPYQQDLGRRLFKGSSGLAATTEGENGEPATAAEVAGE